MMRAILALAALLAVAMPAWAERPLFGHSTAALPEQAGALRARAVGIDLQALGRDRLQLNLFADRRLFAVQTGRRDLGERGQIWLGRLQGEPDSNVVLARVGDALSGTVRLGDELYQIRPLPGGGHLIRQVPGSDPLPEFEPVAPPDLGGQGDDWQPPLALEGSTIADVMVVYTPAARAAVGGSNAMASLIQLAIAETNQAYGNSLIDAQLNLVHSAELAYTEAAEGMGTDLDRLTGTSDGYLDEVHGMRDAYGADLVSLFVERSDYCGIAWLMTSVSSSFASHGFSVVEHGCATGYYSFGHELGHNMGSHHGREDTSGSGAFPYSYGFKQTAGSSSDFFRTIMAYNCSGGCTRRQFFSNPNVSYNGYATGIDHELDPGNSADNARSINNSIGTVSAWRDAVAGSPPAAPGALAALASSSTTMALSWQDLSDNESGFELERSEDGTSWQQVASTAANVTSVEDGGLSPDTGYSYRLRAFNGAGYSGYSNVATANTQPLPTSFNQYVQSEQTARGSLSGSLADLAESDGLEEILTETHSGGRPSGRTSLAEHAWQFSLAQGALHSLVLDARVLPSPEQEAFVFELSLDGSSYGPLLTLAPGAGGRYELPLLSDYAGPLWIRVRDADRSQGNTAYDGVALDQLLVISQNLAGEPPQAPGALTAQAQGSASIALAWQRAAPDDGIHIERSDAGGPWQRIASVDADGYLDSGLQPATFYNYRVQAYNGSGASAYGNEAGASTEAAAISLSADSSKSKGKRTVQLSWTGTGVAVDVLRNGSLIATTADSSYVDAGIKGGGVLQYQVCESGSSVCSNTVSVE
ncbi:fibronectin type III domain-containing protein [Gallaecimonas sp. GXIMD4217]|uniref:M12 family metallo-peptidase n=1 Tax=Gallaecimonas sp. GXIMD4217 TaxID=3131927 RepID=UPI00311B1CD2